MQIVTSEEKNSNGDLLITAKVEYRAVIKVGKEDLEKYYEKEFPDYIKKNLRARARNEAVRVQYMPKPTYKERVL